MHADLNETCAVGKISESSRFLVGMLRFSYLRFLDWANLPLSGEIYGNLPAWVHVPKLWGYDWPPCQWEWAECGQDLHWTWGGQVLPLRSDDPALSEKQSQRVYEGWTYLYNWANDQSGVVERHNLARRLDFNHHRWAAKCLVWAHNSDHRNRLRGADCQIERLPTTLFWGLILNSKSTNTKRHVSFPLLLALYLSRFCPLELFLALFPLGLYHFLLWLVTLQMGPNELHDIFMIQNYAWQIGPVISLDLLFIVLLLKLVQFYNCPNILETVSIIHYSRIKMLTGNLKLTAMWNFLFISDSLSLLKYSMVVS